MKPCKMMVLPIALGVLLSACSTSSRQQSESELVSDAKEQAVIVVPSQTLSSQSVSPRSIPSPLSEGNGIAVPKLPVMRPKVDSNLAKIETLTLKIASLGDDIQSKNALILSLQQQLDDKGQQLFLLNQSLDEKDRTISELQKTTSNAELIAALEAQKAAREELESRYTGLTLDSDVLKRRIAQLEKDNIALTNENTRLKAQVAQLQTLPEPISAPATVQDNRFETGYLALLDENQSLQQEYSRLEADNESNQQRLSSLKNENLILGGALSDARAQHQVLWDKIRSFEVKQAQPLDTSKTPVKAIITPTKSISVPLNASVTDEAPPSQIIPPLQTTAALNYERENAQLRRDLADLKARVERQKRAIASYQNDVVKLEASLDESANYEARWKEMDAKLAQAQQNNTALSIQVNVAQEALATSQQALKSLADTLETTQQALQLEENKGISVAALIDSLVLQTSSTLNNVQWQLPNEIALHNTFEILVSADVQPALSGQTYFAELVTDSDIQMISDGVASAVVQNGRLQWRWRVAGLNEKPKAQLNLFVTQQINFQEQVIERHLYRANQTLSLINTNLFEKYGYWGMAILLGLLGGFLIGRINKSRNAANA
ncbi:hypothetical protein [Marinomonas sp. IMCC 4694]|uniref:hypothetical protein n=1 Tax=Marinomonas sp. IMCC 4694 TaxID=2605432 RepID=UPI0011E6838E|nr:hypothetical protein [Marinomonas sp. IMCC 4694]TYL47783.1 hypothetical protein FXV75_07410 [Marinomonas sp. IMCC 4694]